MIFAPGGIAFTSSHVAIPVLTHVSKPVASIACGKNDFTILETFGGTYESAKTDGRKEFQRMLSYVEANKNSVSHILVYTLDRFSRTGGAAIQLADDLRKKFGVSVFAVTQPTDDSNPNGIFQQNIQLLFSEFDNQLRRQRAMAGMKEKFERGIWCIRPPFGYSIIKENGVKSIVVNKQGEILAQAFEWKAKGFKNEEILVKLAEKGLVLYKQKLSAILKNPFYAGIVSTKMLDGQVVQGTHEQMIPQKLFLQIHAQKKSKQGRYDIVQKTDRCDLPLKVFLQCGACKQPFTGYYVPRKDSAYPYYKCRGGSCRCNVPAKALNARFVDYLRYLQLHPVDGPSEKNIYKELGLAAGGLFDLAELWLSADHRQREKIQWFIFPGGIIYKAGEPLEAITINPLFGANISYSKAA